MGRGVNFRPETRCRVTTIINPITGKTPAWKIEQLLRKYSRDRNITLRICHTLHDRHAELLAREACLDSDLLIAAGGDGTVSAVISGALGSQIPVGIIPNGSTNMLAKDLGIPTEPHQAIRLAMEQVNILEIDSASINGENFLHIAGVGYDAQIMKSTSSKWKHRLRWLAYTIPALTHLRMKPFQADLCIDGECSAWQAKMVIFALGGSIIQSRIQMGDHISRSDGLLDILVYDPPTVFGVVTAGLWILAGRPSKAKWQHHLRGRRATLQTDRPVAYQADGDYLGNSPVTIEMNHLKARILVPAQNSKLDS